MRGRLVVFEGLDGSGITTQATLFRNFLVNKGKDAVLTKEPTDGLIGGLIKSSLRKEWKTNPLSLQMLFAADRAHHLTTEIEPALKNGKIVVCDRYVLSSLVFGGSQLSVDILKRLNANFLKPHMTIFIDTQPKLCVERMKRARHHVELFEEEHKLEQIRKLFLSLLGYFPNTYIVDGNRVPQEILDEVVKVAKKIL